MATDATSSIEIEYQPWQSSVWVTCYVTSGLGEEFTVNLSVDGVVVSTYNDVPWSDDTVSLTTWYSLATLDPGIVAKIEAEVVVVADGQQLSYASMELLTPGGPYTYDIVDTIPETVKAGNTDPFTVTLNLTNGAGQYFDIQVFQDDTYIGNYGDYTDARPGSTSTFIAECVPNFLIEGPSTIRMDLLNINGEVLGTVSKVVTVTSGIPYPSAATVRVNSPDRARVGTSISLDVEASVTASKGQAFRLMVTMDGTALYYEEKTADVDGAVSFAAVQNVVVTSTGIHMLDATLTFMSDQVTLATANDRVGVFDASLALLTPDQVFAGETFNITMNGTVFAPELNGTYKLALSVDGQEVDVSLHTAAGYNNVIVSRRVVEKFMDAGTHTIGAVLTDSLGSVMDYKTLILTVVEPVVVSTLALTEPGILMLGKSLDLAATAAVTNGLGKNYTLRIFVDNQPFTSQTKASATENGVPASYSVSKAFTPTDTGVYPITAELMDSTGLVVKRQSQTLNVYPKPDAATGIQLTWKKLDTGSLVGSGASTPVAASTDWRLLCEVPASRWNTGFGGLRQSAFLINYWGAEQSLLVFEDAPGVLSCDIYGADRQYPTWEYADEYGNNTVPDNNVVEYAKRGYIPRGTVAAMWGEVLCIADTAWFSDSTTGVAHYKETGLSAGNTSRYRSGFWSSYVSPAGIPEVTAFHPVKSFNYGFMSPEAVIVDMRVCDAGLLIFTEEAGDNDGVVLLRGKPYDYRVVVIRGHIGLQSEGKAAEWQDAGVFAFVDEVGHVWQTDGTEIDRLDRIGPEVTRDLTQCKYDQCAPVGSWLFVLRSGKLTLLNLLDRGQSGNGEAAWTSLVAPPGAATQLLAIGQSLYMVAGGQLYRYALLSKDRAVVGGKPVVSSATTAVLGDPSSIRKMRWGRVGVRAHSESTNGRVLSIASIAGSIRDVTPAPRLTSDVNVSVADSTIVVARGHGRSRLASFQVTFAGDVTVDGFEVLVAGTEDDRTAGNA